MTNDIINKLLNIQATDLNKLRPKSDFIYFPLKIFSCKIRE